VNASAQLSPPPPSPVGQQGDELLVSPQGK
jgi:hypothetical protein